MRMRFHQSWQSRDLAQLFLMLSQQYHVFYLSWNTHQTFILLIESLKCPPYNNSGLSTLSSTPILVCFHIYLEDARCSVTIVIQISSEQKHDINSWPKKSMVYLN
jgi:hypothetical protein